MILSEDKKLAVTYRVEPGCLGPDGNEHIQEFCAFARSRLQYRDAECLKLMIHPREIKSLPELQYSLSGKTLSRDQARKYLTLFEVDLDEFEGLLCEDLSTLIDHYMNSRSSI